MKKTDWSLVSRKWQNLTKWASGIRELFEKGNYRLPGIKMCFLKATQHFWSSFCALEAPFPWTQLLPKAVWAIISAVSVWNCSFMSIFLYSSLVITLRFFHLSVYTLPFSLIITSQVQKQKAWKLIIFSSLWEFKKKGHGMAEFIKPFLFSRMTLKIKLIKLSSKKKKKKKSNTLSLSMEKPLLRIVLCLAQSSALSRTNPLPRSVSIGYLILGLM